MNDLAFGRTPAENQPRLAARQDAAAGERAVHGALPILLKFLRIAKRRKWLLVGSVAVVMILGLIGTLLTTPQYTADATLEIQRENYRIVEVRGVEPEASSVDLEFYQTQYGLLKARSLAERVATNMRLYENADFFEMFGATNQANAVREGGRNVSPAARQQRIRDAADILQAHVAVVPARTSRLVDVRFTSPNPALSAQIVNAWTQHFIEMTLGRRFEATSYARRFLEQRLGQLRQRLEESERDLVRYASNQRIINIPSTSTTAGSGVGVSVTERPLVAEDLAMLNQALNAAIADRTVAESRLRGTGGATTEALQNPVISTLRSRRAELAAEQSRLLTQFEPQYPPAQALANQIRELDRSISREEGRVQSTLQTTYASAVARESSLRSRVDALQTDLLNLRGRTIQYNIYQREVDTNRQLYDALLQRYKEIGVAGGVGVNNISVVDPASVPERPSSPNLILNMLLSLLVGGTIGAGLAIALEQVDEAISDPTDVERALGLPLLGTIPKASSDPAEADLEDRKSPLVEAYLSMQTSLAFTTDHGIPRTLTVTSTRPGEGKTMTSYALARSLARTGRSVCLVDADMRSPSLHHIFDVKNTQGLSNYLAGSGDISAMLHRGLPDNIALLTAGPSPPNAAELLIGDRIGTLVQELAEKYDHVILDVPPVMGLADTPLVASQIEGVIFVVESHATRASMARVAVGRLQDAQARVLGVLLTKFESRRAHYGYGYEYGYGYGENSTKT
ncbi:MAG TPA: polysaccharide biosynthesis tyrosine autokinase [Allosphingosinicella sp.]|nr:polysaccharide biosynthesis tyrosine autokinase [Allosphingosinicella sp.]